MSILKILLFVSSTSKASAQTIRFLKENQLGGVTVVRLDTSEAREAAATGKYFQITVVPSLVVLYEDGNMQMFIGVEKIVSWFQMLKGRPAKSQDRSHKPPRSANIYDTDPSETGGPPPPRGIGPLPIPRGIPRKKTYDEGYRAPIVDEGSDLDEELYYNEEEYNQPRYAQPKYHQPEFYDEEGGENVEDEEEIFIEPEAKPKPTHVKHPKAKKKSKAKKLISEDDNPGLREAKEKLNKAAASKSKRKDGKMKGVYAEAKRMQEEMSSSLGYREEDLPHY